MIRERKVIALCIWTCLALALLILVAAMLIYPHVSWRLLRRYLLVIIPVLGCAAFFGRLLGRSVVSILAQESDQQQARLRMFLSETGHELRTPLTIIGSSIDIIRRALPVSNVTDQALIDGVMQELRRLNLIVNNVLLLARLDVIKDAKIEAVDVSQTLEELAAEARLREPALEIGVCAPPGIMLSIDRTALRESIRNLIDNAMKYAPHSPISLCCEVSDLAVEIVVKDLGPGMDTEDLCLAVERYYRGQAALHIEGTGLGLAIVKSTMERSGGTVQIASSLGEGVSVTLTLPRTEQTPQQPNAAFTRRKSD